MLDGAAKVGPLFAEAKRLGMTAIGMTDHGNMFGPAGSTTSRSPTRSSPSSASGLYRTGVAILHKRVQWGTRDQRSDDVSGSGSLYPHVDGRGDAAGLRNLFKLSSLASIEGQLGKVGAWTPTDRAVLIGDHRHDGLPFGEVQTVCGSADQQALEAAAKWRDIFSPENFYLELMEQDRDREPRVRRTLEIGRKLHRPLATNDCHYVAGRRRGARALLCVQTGKTLSDPARFKVRR